MILTAGIRVAAAGLGAAVAGPLGGAVGGWLGGALGDSASSLVGKYAEQFGEKAGEKLLDIGADSLADGLKQPAKLLQGVYRESLRVSLARIRAETPWDGFEDWFENWETCLSSNAILNLSSIAPDQLAPDKLDGLFRMTMERLDAQGSALRRGQLSLALKTRSIDQALLGKLTDRLPDRLRENFEALITSAENDQAWKESLIIFNEGLSSALGRIEQKQDKIFELLSVGMERARQEGRLEGRKDAESDRAELLRLREAYRVLQEQVASRAADPGESQLSKLLSAGDIGAALELKKSQVQAGITEHARQTDKLARDQYELGRLYELRFDWGKALEAYRAAWRLKRDPEFGFSYAYCLQRQNNFSEAIATYELLRGTRLEPADRASTLNNVGILYSDTQRFQDAEEAYSEALSIRRELAQADPGAYLPEVATTLNNLAVLYRATQRMKESEQAHLETLSIRRSLANTHPDAYLPEVAATLNNLANVYGDTQRLKDAEEAYREALSFCRALANANPGAYLPEVAMTLNNLAVLYRNSHRLIDSEETYQEALSIRRSLANTNPDAYLPDVAVTLNNLAVLYCVARSLESAEEAYREALSIFRNLANASPDAYLPDVASTLNNLANLCSDTQRLKEAEEFYGEALATYRELARANSGAYLHDVAMTLSNLAILYYSTLRFKDADAYCREAMELLEPMWRVNPEVHGDVMARILCVRADLCEPLGQSHSDACAFARRAIAVAYDPTLKPHIEARIDRFCSGAD